MKKSLSNILSKYIDVFGFCSVNEYMLTRSSLQNEDSFDDYSLIKDYQTIITIALSYPTGSLPKKEGHGNISRYSYGTDYHLVMKQKMDLIEAELKELNIKSLATVDTGPIDERWAGYLCGIGYLGKNQYLINKEYGGYMYLATILIDIDIDKEFTVLDTCGNCNLCVTKCPTNALDGGFIKDRCISYITQSKHEFNDVEIETVSDLIYGCDICLQVCPKNTGIDFHKHNEFEPIGIEQINLIDIIKMTNKEYNNVYKDNASSWRGPLIIKRNALCLLANQNDINSIKVIEESIDKYKGVLWYNNVALKVLEKLKGVKL